MIKKPEFEALEGLDSSYLPSCKTKFSAGLDIKTTKDLNIFPGEIVKFGSGVKIKSIDESHYFQCHLRSSLRFIYGLDQMGTGIIDADYKGEIGLLLINNSKKIVSIKKSERIAQLILCENLTQKYCSEYCEENERDGGFGSTNEKGE